MASAAAHDTGLPPYVDPCVPTVHVIFESLAIMAPSGIPLAMPLPASKMSGSTPKCSTAHIVPVRPMPDCTSSQIRVDAVPVAERAERLEPSVGRHDVAPLAQDRLDHDRGHLARATPSS